MPTVTPQHVTRYYWLLDVLSCSLVVCPCCVPCPVLDLRMGDLALERSAAFDPARDEFPVQMEPPDGWPCAPVGRDDFLDWLGPAGA